MLPWPPWPPRCAAPRRSPQVTRRGFPVDSAVDYDALKRAIEALQPALALEGHEVRRAPAAHV